MVTFAECKLERVPSVPRAIKCAAVLECPHVVHCKSTTQQSYVVQQHSRQAPHAPLQSTVMTSKRMETLCPQQLCRLRHKHCCIRMRHVSSTCDLIARLRLLISLSLRQNGLGHAAIRLRKQASACQSTCRRWLAHGSVQCDTASRRAYALQYNSSAPPHRNVALLADLSVEADIALPVLFFHICAIMSTREVSY